jgi:hypothetical protein
VEADYSHDEYEDVPLGGGLYASYADEPALESEGYDLGPTTAASKPWAWNHDRSLGSVAPLSTVSIPLDGRFTPRELWAIGQYAYFGQTLNQWLRFGDSDLDFEGEDPDNLAALLNGAIKRCDPVPEGAVIWRGIDLASYERLYAAGIGGLVTDAGFLSTTRNERVAEDFALRLFALRYQEPHPPLDQLVWRILPLPGTRALPITPVMHTAADYGSWEEELVLAPGCRFRIEHDGRPILRMVETNEPAIQVFGQRGTEMLTVKDFTNKLHEAADYARCSHWWGQGTTYNPACRH